MKKIYLFVVLCLLTCLAGNVFAQMSTFNYTGASQTFTVPAGITTVLIDMQGAAGGTSGYPGTPSPGGRGGRVQCFLTVTPGVSYPVYVGGKGANGANGCVSAAGGFNGGVSNGTKNYAAGSGGATDIRTPAGALANRLVVAGGGGGGGYNCSNNENGGDGGGLVGQAGWNCGTPGSGGYVGGGGGQSLIANGNSYYGTVTYEGTLGVGGPAYTSSCTYGSAGGGGYYGGGGGGYYGAGGGGSSYTDPTLCSNVVHTQGYNTITSATTGNGQVLIYGPTVTAVPGSLAFAPTTTGTTSASLTTSITGIVMATSGTVTITPPNNFQVSPDNINWFTNASPYTYTYAGTGFTSIPLYVQFSPSSPVPYTGNLQITGGGLLTAFNIPLTGTGAAACAATPTAGTSNASPTIGGAATPFILSLTGTSASGGLTYQWQSGPAVGGPFTNIYGATNPTFSFTGVSVNTYFRCVVGCPGNGTANSTPVLITWSGIAASSCSPTFGSPSSACFTYSMYMRISSLVGASGSIADVSGCNGSTNYENLTGSTSVTLNSGSTYTANCQTGYSSTSMSCQIWIDFNEDGIFQSSESVGGSSSMPTQTTGVSIVIPAGLPTGTHRMRIVGNYYPCCNGVQYPNMPPCPTSTITYGDCRDYTVTISGGTVNATVNANPTTLSFGSVTVNTTSVPPLFFTLNGTNLSVTPLTITTPSSNFAVSTDGVNWSNTTLTLGYTPGYPTGSLSTTNVYVRFTPTAVTSYSGNITVTGGGLASAVNVAVTGNGQNVCSGAPSAGTAAVNPTTGGPVTALTLSLTGTTATGGLTYQWQSAPAAGGPYTNMPGAITPTYSFVGEREFSTSV